MDDLLNNREVNSMKKLNKHYSKIIPYYGERFGDSDKFERIITTQRHEYIDREKDKKNLNVLDLGCGPGLYLKHMNLIAKELHACDLSSLMITHAKKENKYVKDFLELVNKGKDVLNPEKSRNSLSSKKQFR